MHPASMSDVSGQRSESVFVLFFVGVSYRTPIEVSLGLLLRGRVVLLQVVALLKVVALLLLVWYRRHRRTTYHQHATSSHANTGGRPTPSTMATAMAEELNHFA